ncbi:MAG: hypothetical protein Tsb0015_11880 [Simkaniaceae bacterium]
MKIFDELLEVADQLNGPKGCPWDRKQTFESLQKYVLEEAEEVALAVSNKDYENLKEELGDLLYTIIFYAKIASKKKLFTIEDIISGVKEKLVRRHPHVFGEEEILDAESVSKRWQEIKEEERKQKNSLAKRKENGFQ